MPPAPFNAREILAVAAAVRAALNAEVDGHTIEAEVRRTIAAGIGGPDEAAPETAAERRERRNNAELALLDELKGQGKGREAVGILARRLVVDPRNPVEIASECRRLRRLRQKRPRGSS
jgi:hypothetical protein